MENSAVFSSNGGRSFSITTGTVEWLYGGSVVTLTSFSVDRSVVFGPGEDVMFDAEGFTVEG